MRTDKQMPIEVLEKTLGTNWKNLRDARETSVVSKKRLSDKLFCEQPDEDNSVVTYGSLARNEFTQNSDIDWTLIIDGRVSADHKQLITAAHKIIKEECTKDVGRENTFGGISYGHDLVHKIGGNEDTNKNTTQRILLLLESYPLGHAEAYNRVKHEILSRYIKEDWGIYNTENKVPRFLLNDIARYWRTMCVDFAYKRRDRNNQGWALKTIKLRLSRKLIYVSGLLSCYSCKTDEILSDQLSLISGIENKQDLLIEHLLKITSCTPLDILSKMILPYEDLYEPARTIIDSYDEFIGLLNDNEYRQHLDELKPQDTNSDVVYDKARDLGHRFQSGLDKIFFCNNSSMFFELTKQYGVF